MLTIRDHLDAMAISTVGISDIMKAYPFSKTKTFRGMRVYILTSEQVCTVLKSIPGFFPKFSTSVDVVCLEDGIKQMTIRVRSRVLDIYFEERAN